MGSRKHTVWTSSTDTFREDLEDVCLRDNTKRGDPIPLPKGDRPDVFSNTLHETIFVAVIALGAASSVFIQRSIVVIASNIGDDLNASPAQIAWLNGATGLTTGALLLPFGYLSDASPITYRKYLLLVSMTAFSLIVAFTSFSPNGIVVDLMLGLCGVACAATIPIAVGLLSLLYPIPSRRKNIVFSSFLTGNPAATIIGGLGSGALATTFNWKATFIFLGILYASVTIVSFIVVPNIPEPPSDSPYPEVQHWHVADSFTLYSTYSTSFLNTLLDFDWAGLLLLIIGVLLFTVALTIGPQDDQQWKTPAVIMLLTLGLLLMGCFILWENSTSAPMIPPSIWQNWSVTLVNLSALCTSMAYYSAVFWISIFLQRVEGLQPFDIAVRLLPQALMGLFCSPLVCLFMHRVSGTMLLVIAGFCSVISHVALIFIRQESSYLPFILPSLILGTVGMDWTMNVGSLHVLSVLPLMHHSIGASLLQTTTRLGVPLGMGITTAIWTSYSSSEYDARLPYSKVFVSTASFAIVSLAIAPFIKIGRLGCVKEKNTVRREGSGKNKEKDVSEDHRPSKRWSIVDTVSNKSILNSPKVDPPISTFSLLSDNSGAEKEKKPPPERPFQDAPYKRIVWVVCEQCNASRRVTDPIGDPARYFNDLSCGSPGPAKRMDHDMIVNGRRRFPLAAKQQNTPH